MTTPRSLADYLRGRDDGELQLLLLRRADLAVPVPGDIGQLAGRSVTASSTSRALDHLDRFHLQVLEATVACDEPFALSDVQELFADESADGVAAAVAELFSLALLWGEQDALRPTVALRESLGRFPGGLGPPLAHTGGGDLDRLCREIADAPPEPREVLEALTWGPPTGRVRDADRPIAVEEAATPVEWLLARRILRPLDKGTVVLPRELGLHLRGGRLHQFVAMTVPDADAHHVDPLVVDRLASATAHEVVRRTEVLLDLWAADPPGVLKSGGLGVRDLRSTAAGLNVDDDIAALIIEISWAAGLLAKTGEVGDEWLPTPAYDAWRVASTASRWLTLAAAWLGTPHVPSLVGTTDASGGRVNPLTSDVERIVAPDIRRWVLDDLAAMPPGTAVSTASMVARHEWRRPRRGGRLRDDLVQWTLHEAGALGLVARGAMSSFGGSLLADETADATELLTALLPPPVDHIVLQADLTAVAPGPLRDDLARELALLADVESSGGATVYRFSDRSVRRSLDAGRSSSDIHGFLARISTTPVPQPLTYLVDDVSRKHGAVRVGGATAYVRCDEPSTLDELMASRGLDALRLRRLAPTVVVCGAAPDVVLDRLRTHGLAPALESSEGIVVLTERAARRTGPRAVPTQLAVDPPPASPAVASSIVRALRAAERGADRGAAVRGPGLGADVPRTALSETLDVLHRAVEDKKSVWLGYIDNHGVSGERVVDPVSVSNGRLTAYDHRTDGIRQFAVHRVTGVTLL